MGLQRGLMGVGEGAEGCPGWEWAAAGAPAPGIAVCTSCGVGLCAFLASPAASRWRVPQDPGSTLPPAPGSRPPPLLAVLHLRMSPGLRPCPRCGLRWLLRPSCLNVGGGIRNRARLK